ncbi:MAG: acyltransferase domain-containing protein [Bacteroidetes bacterium]|nr:acyltransferase domain-containing protein [Bacteroidota bacterium]
MAAKLAQRFDWVSELLSEADSIFKHYGEENVIGSIYRLQERVLNNAEENLWKDILKQTNIAQPAITLASLAWFKYLEKLGIKINAATGHSLGELMAFHATGLLSQETLLKFAVSRRNHGRMRLRNYGKLGLSQGNSPEIHPVCPGVCNYCQH